MKTVYIDRPIEPLIGANEAAKFLGFSSLTVRRMAHKNLIPSVAYPMANGKFLHRFRVSDLKEFLESITRRPVLAEVQSSQEDLARRAS